jgi:hypothetical protein
MQGLSPEHLDGSQPLSTSTPEGSPRQSEATVITTPQVEQTNSIERFRITNTREDFRLHQESERRFMRENSSGDLIVVYSGSLTGPFPGIEGQDPFWSTSVFRRDLFGLGSLVISEINPLLQLHLLTVLFISNDRASTQFCDPPPKGVVWKLAFNPHAHAAQNYSIVEDLAQAPSAMLAPEVLQTCPAQRKALLKAIDGIDLTDTNLIVFDLDDHIPRLPPQLALQIQFVVSDKNICRTIIDEGASMCVMSFAC